jgi:hypothetical protein
MKNRISPTFLLLLAILALIIALVGCGGDGRNPATLPTANPFAGTYHGVTELGDDRDGALSLTASSTGVLTGNLTITAATRAYDFQIGTFGITGSVSDSGAFTLTGTIPGSGPFTITGQLAMNGNPGSFTLVAGGESYGGTIAAGNGGGGTGGDSTLVFSAPNGTNANLTDLNLHGFVGFLTSGGSTTVDAGVVTGADTRRVQMAIATTVQVGQTVPISGSNEVFIAYLQGTPGAAKAWRATSGSLKLVRLTDTEIEVELIDAYFQPSDTPLGAEGTFVLNGTIKK